MAFSLFSCTLVQKNFFCVGLPLKKGLISASTLFPFVQLLFYLLLSVLSSLLLSLLILPICHQTTCSLVATTMVKILETPRMNIRGYGQPTTTYMMSGKMPKVALTLSDRLTFVLRWCFCIGTSG